MKTSGEHRRGRSMGSAPPPAVVRSGEKDEDLALFHEMKRREKHNFLYPAPDDLDATLSSKFGGMGAPAKKPGTDLLTSESDKNDYDWLLTPPGTPLFPSLDQEAAALAVLSPALSNGSFSSASSASKSLKSSTYSPAESVKGSRGNPSPRRQLSAPSSTTPNGISRSRSSPGTAPVLTRPSTPTSTGGTRPSTPTSKPSTRSSTPNLKLTVSHSAKSYSNTTPTGTRPSTPTPRSSTPPVRPSTPGGRSSTPTSKPSTPTMRRSLSGGRTGITSPSPTTSRGGPSPKRTTSSSRGNSPSAKRITSVITSIAGMSSEAPPNLRTSMPERSLSTGKSNHSNGSRNVTDNYNSMEDSAQSRRRPRSPSVARSFSSSSSQEQRTSSQTSRGSVISSYDDGLEVNRPSYTGSGRNSVGKWHATGHEELLTGKPSAYANRAAKSPITRRDSSGYGGTPTKRSSDMSKRPVDAYQNSPTTAYRHLHSNSPMSPFTGNRTNSLLLRSGVGMNTSMTTSSNASSEHGTTVAADTEGSERDEDDLLSWDSYGRRASMSPRLQQADILVLDKDDEKTVPWQDSLFERANSHGPSSSHSQGSQSTLDAEVTGFYETDGIASLEMLEQLGVMGESYQLKKSSSIKGRSSEKRNISTEDGKVPNYGTDDYGHSRISPHKVLHELQGSPARHLAHLEKQDSLDPARRSRDFDSKIPTHLLFQENHGSPLRHLPNLVRPEEVSERPRKSRDFESRSSPRRLSLESPGSPARQLARLESPGSPARQLARLESPRSPARQLARLESPGSPARQLVRLEKHESLERPRRSRDFESKSSPRRLSLESQGSPARNSNKLEQQEILERPRSRDFDFEAELLRRNGEKSVGSLEPQAPNSEIRAACLFVRDFKVGLSPTQNRDTPEGNSPGGKKLAIEEMEMKLRNELSYDWDNSVESLESSIVGSNGDVQRRYSAPPLVSRSKKNLAPESSARHSLDFPFTSADVVYPTNTKDSLLTPEISNEADRIDTREQELALVKDVDLTHHFSVKSTPASTAIENSFANDWMMDESDTESIQPKGVDMDYLVPLEGSRPSGMVHSVFDLQKVANQDYSLLNSQVPSIRSDLSDDGVYAMDEDTTEVPTPEDCPTAPQSEEESAVLEECVNEEHVPVTENQHNNPMDVDEASITVPEKYRGEDENVLQAEIQHEAAREEELYKVLSSEEDAARAKSQKMQHSGADHGQSVVREDLDGMWYPEADNQKGVVEHFLQAVPCSVGINASEATEKAVLCGEDEPETMTEEADGMHSSERQIEQVVQSNSDHLYPKEECIVVLEKESIPHHNMEPVSGNGTVKTGLQKLPETETESAAVGDKESSLWNIYPYVNAVEQNEKSALHSDDPRSVEHAQEDVPTFVAELEGKENPAADVVEIKATQGIVKEASVCSSNQQLQESSQSLEYFDADCVATVDDTGDEASSKLSNHLIQEESQSLNYPNSDSQKDLHYLSDSKDDKDFLEKDTPSLLSSQSHYLSDVKWEKDFLQKDIPSIQSSEESPAEDVDLFHMKLSEFDARCVEGRQLPYGSADGNKTSSNCKPKAVQFVDKHSEVLDLFPSTEDISQVQPPKTEFRSASTLCAALEEQIAGLIQKIDSAIEESSKPFSSSPQESLLVKDKRSILEPEQDDFTGSMRSSQEEDLLDMLWAEDDETSCSEGSRDHDIMNGKDCSQREMNGVRSSRLSERVLPVSLLGQSNEAFEAVVRSSRSDPGVEKRMLEGSSKRIAVSPLDQQDDVLMHNQEPMKGPVTSPLLWSTELNTQKFGLHDSVPEDTHFHLEAQSNIDKSSGERGHSNPDDLRTVSFGQEYGSDSVTESSSYDDVDIKTDAELLSLCKVAEPVCDSDTQTKSPAVSVSATPDDGPPEYEVSARKEIFEGDATSSEEITQRTGDSSEAAQKALPDEHVALGSTSREVNVSDIKSIGNAVTSEANDQAFEEFSHNGDTDESSILLTLAHSEIWSKVGNEVPNDELLPERSLLEETSRRPIPSVTEDDEWLPESSSLPEETSSRPIISVTEDDEWLPESSSLPDETSSRPTPSVGHVTEDDEWLPESSSLPEDTSSRPTPLVGHVTEDDEWLPESSSLPEDTSSRPIPSVGHVTEDDEWLPESSSLPEETSSRPISSVGHVTEDDEWLPERSSLQEDTSSRPISSVCHVTEDDEWLPESSNLPEETSSRPISCVGHVTEDDEWLPESSNLPETSSRPVSCVGHVTEDDEWLPDSSSLPEETSSRPTPSVGHVKEDDEWLPDSSSLPEETSSRPTPSVGHVTEDDEWLPESSSLPEETSSRPIPSVGHVTEDDECLPESSSLPVETSGRPIPSMGRVTEEHALEFQEEPQRLKEPEVLPERCDDSSCPSRTSEFVDAKREETQGKDSVHVDHFLRDADIGSVQDSEDGEDIYPLRLSPDHEDSSGQFSFVLGAEEQSESSSGRESRDGAKVMRDTNGTSDYVVESTQIPESNSTINGDHHPETYAHAEDEVEGEHFTSQCSSEGRRISPSNLQFSPRDGAVESREISFEETVALPEIRMVQGSPERSRGASSNGSLDEVLIQKSESNQRHKDSWQGQHTSLISGDKIRAERESFRMENDSGAEPGEHSSLLSEMAANTIVREKVNMEAHVDDTVQPQESQIHVKGEGIAEGPGTEGREEVTTVSVLGELPATNSKPLKIPAAREEEMKATDEDLAVSANGNGDLGTREDKDSRVGIQSVKRLPSNKAKSVRTISLSPRTRSQTESPPEEPSSPEVDTPQKPSAYTNFEVVSSESLQYENSSPGVETPTKARSSPGSLSRNMTAAEATDSILFRSSLMNTIVCQAAVCANEKEENAAVSSTPTSNAEVPHNPDPSEVREESHSEVGEAGNCKSQGLSTPPSVRRALSYMGHQTVPLTPADTSLQIPVDQVIDMKALEATVPTATKVNSKDEVMPAKASKAKCGCTIM